MPRRHRGPSPPGRGARRGRDSQPLDHHYARSLHLANCFPGWLEVTG
jgi:hypothetical protein